MKYTKYELTGKVQTVLGLTSGNELGITLSHEHCFIDIKCDFVEPKETTPKIIANEPLSLKNIGYVRYGHDNLDNMQRTDEGLAINELIPFRDAGWQDDR
jgi:predicted metal-dependent phosphotriesterase family hydrolase